MWWVVKKFDAVYSGKWQAMDREMMVSTERVTMMIATAKKLMAMIIFSIIDSIDMDGFTEFMGRHLKLLSLQRAGEEDQRKRRQVTTGNAVFFQQLIISFLILLPLLRHRLLCPFLCVTEKSGRCCADKQNSHQKKQVITEVE